MAASVYNSLQSKQFVMPSKYNQENIVNPNDQSITVYSSKPGYYAAIRYGGYSNDDKVKKHHNRSKVNSKKKIFKRSPLK